jgi:hypothetical protein
MVLAGIFEQIALNPELPVERGVLNLLDANG